MKVKSPKKSRLRTRKVLKVGPSEGDFVFPNVLFKYWKPQGRSDKYWNARWSQAVDSSPKEKPPENPQKF